MDDNGEETWLMMIFVSIGAFIFHASSFRVQKGRTLVGESAHMHLHKSELRHISLSEISGTKSGKMDLK
jgi:hypothetical protein